MTAEDIIEKMEQIQTRMTNGMSANAVAVVIVPELIEAIHSLAQEVSNLRLRRA